MIKILLVDDHKMFIDGLRAFLEKDEKIDIVGEALSGEATMVFLEKNPVDVVVLDIEMKGINGVETTALIKKKFPKTRVLILSMHKKKRFIVGLFKAGASGYVLKNKSKEELLGAIYNVYEGRPHFGLEVLKVASSIDEPQSQYDYEPEVKLTERETEVLILVAKGFTTQAISDQLFISKLTVNTHRRNLLQKLDLPNAQHLVIYAIKNGLISID